MVSFLFGNHKKNVFFLFDGARCKNIQGRSVLIGCGVEAGACFETNMFVGADTSCDVDVVTATKVALGLIWQSCRGSRGHYE